MWNAIDKEQESTERFGSNDLANFEEMFEIELSNDHKAFLTEFGEGVLFNYVRIFGLSKIEREYREFQERWGEYYLWDSPESALSKSDLMESIIIGDTFNGDEFVISPNKKGIYFLPQDDDRISCLGKGLESAIVSYVETLQKEVAKYDNEERDEWDLRPVFNCEYF